MVVSGLDGVEAVVGDEFVTLAIGVHHVVDVRQPVLYGPDPAHGEGEEADAHLRADAPILFGFLDHGLDLSQVVFEAGENQAPELVSLDIRPGRVDQRIYQAMTAGRSPTEVFREAKARDREGRGEEGCKKVSHGAPFCRGVIALAHGAKLH